AASQGPTHATPRNRAIFHDVAVARDPRGGKLSALVLVRRPACPHRRRRAVPRTRRLASLDWPWPPRLVVPRVTAGPASAGQARYASHNSDAWGWPDD